MRTFSLVCAVALSAGAIAGASGCSVLNSFDELQEASTAGTGGGGTAGSGAQGGTSGGGSGGTSGGTGGTGGSGGTAAPPGLIVVAGDGDLEAGGRGLVISAISPYTGEEYTRREVGAGKVGSIAYDGVADVWYLWSQQTGVADLYDFKVLKFNRTKRDWDELGTLAAPGPKGMIAVLNKRILYWSYYKEGTTPTEGFTLINTDDLSGPQLIQPVQSAAPFTESPLGAVPRANATAEGGTVNLFVRARQQDCVAEGTTEGGQDVIMCPISRYLASVAKSSTQPSFAGAPLSIGKIRQSGGSIAAIKASDEDALAFPDPAWERDTNTNSTATVKRFNPTGFTVSKSVNFTVQGSNMRGAAWDPCNKFFFATESLSDTAVFVVPTEGGTTYRQGITSPPVGAVYFDQYTRTVFQPRDDPDNYALRAFSLEGDATTPSLKERDGNSDPPWNPPSDVRPSQMLVETPENQFCQ